MYNIVKETTILQQAREAERFASGRFNDREVKGLMKTYHQAGRPFEEAVSEISAHQAKVGGRMPDERKLAQWWRSFHH
ncbi:MAG: hypothetical protein IKK43_00190 [Clostridia bacterium]|nr:hypothetical protein [Clostridia bacterium]